MKRLAGLLVSATLMISVCSHVYCEENKELFKEELFKVFKGKLKELNLSFIDMEKIKYDTFDAGIESSGNKKLWNVACLHGGATMDIDPISRRVISFLNDAYSRKVKETTYQQEPKPTKNQEEMIKEAERYIKIINGDIPDDIYFEEAKFIRNTSGLKSDYYHDGEWLVSWRRKEGNYKYWWDRITLSIHEKYGLSGYHYELFSQYHAPDKINISEAKAISIAKKNINKIIRSPLLGGWYNGFKTGECRSMGLMIVNPNYIHIPQKNYSAHPKTYARLAWVIGFATADNTIPGITVWIDAETGEVLGGG